MKIVVWRSLARILHEQEINSIIFSRQEFAAIPQCSKKCNISVKFSRSHQRDSLRISCESLAKPMEERLTEEEKFFKIQTPKYSKNTLIYYPNRDELNYSNFMQRNTEEENFEDYLREKYFQKISEDKLKQDHHRKRRLRNLTSVSEASQVEYSTSVSTTRGVSFENKSTQITSNGNSRNSSRNSSRKKLTIDNGFLSNLYKCRKQTSNKRVASKTPIQLKTPVKITKPRPLPSTASKEKIIVRPLPKEIPDNEIKKGLSTMRPTSRRGMLSKGLVKDKSMNTLFRKLKRQFS